MEIEKLIKSGFAGVDGFGTIKDRREFPNAIPMQKNELLGIPEPLPLQKREFKFKFDGTKLSVNGQNVIVNNMFRFVVWIAAKDGYQKAFDIVADHVGVKEILHDEMKELDGALNRPKIGFHDGMKVTYVDRFKGNEKGIVFRTPLPTEDFVPVVFNCGEDWSQYKKYTAQRVNRSKLVKGWVTDEEE